MSSTAGGPNNADADVSADDVPPTDEVIPADEILDIPVPLADDDLDPPPLAALPIDFHFEDNIPLTEAQQRHRIAFYQAALSSFLVKGSNSSMMMKEKWEMIRTACLRLHNGETRSALKRAGFIQIAAWDKKYGIVSVGGEHVLVERVSTTRKRKKRRRHPTADGDDEVGAESSDDEQPLQSPTTDLDRMRRLSYMERLYNDILREHGDHNRGATLSFRVAERWCNISRDWTTIFTKTCPQCIERAPKPKPVAGLRNIITYGWGMRGQVDIIDLQSMKDGIFKYLLNYIDHGVKFLWSVPLVAKRASCIALALYEIFCTIGAPMILQTDNGKEFSGAATTNKQRRRDKEALVGNASVISPELLNEVVTEVRNLWPECIMVTGTPRHSESNGGVERVNRTVQ